MPRNKEYISREEALRQIFLEAMGHDFDFNDEHRKIYISAKRAVKNTPAADVVEVRHGRWEERPVNVDTPTTDLFCSECNFASYHWRYNYCPNCGAKMDKEE